RGATPAPRLRRLPAVAAGVAGALVAAAVAMPSATARTVPMQQVAQMPQGAQMSRSQSPNRSAFVPSTLFIQGGVAEEAQMAIIGATWEWDWYHDFAIGRLGGYWEFSIGRWNSDVDDNGGSAWVTQFGVTPVLRLYPHSWGGR